MFCNNCSKTSPKGKKIQTKLRTHDLYFVGVISAAKDEEDGIIIPIPNPLKALKIKKLVKLFANADEIEKMQTKIEPATNTGFLPLVSDIFPAIKAPIKNPMKIADPVNPF